MTTNPVAGAPLPVSRLSVALVQPFYSGNIGQVARAMLNFGVSDLLLVNGPPLDDVMRKFAVHAAPVLDSARRRTAVRELRREFAHVIGFTAKAERSELGRLPRTESLATIVQRLGRLDGRAVLVFGPERPGLEDHDVDACDMICTIPTARYYRSMNLSHAVAVVLATFLPTVEAVVPRLNQATPGDRDALLARWHAFQVGLGAPALVIEERCLALRRVIGRGGLTAEEAQTLLHAFSDTLD